MSCVLLESNSDTVSIYLVGGQKGLLTHITIPHNPLHICNTEAFDTRDELLFILHTVASELFVTKLQSQLYIVIKQEFTYKLYIIINMRHHMIWYVCDIWCVNFMRLYTASYLIIQFTVCPNHCCRSLLRIITFSCQWILTIRLGHTETNKAKWILIGFNSYALKWILWYLKT